MKYLALFIGFMIFCLDTYAQEKPLTIYKIHLPKTLTEAENQFSGLQVAHDKLYLMPECRLQEKHLARIYSINLSDIEKNKKDSNYVLPFQTIPIFGLDSLAAAMGKEGNEYEGLEAMIIAKQNVYFSVETTTPSPSCYLLKGTFRNGNIYMEPILTPIRKPTQTNGNGIYNAGFEAISIFKKKLIAFFEFNYFVPMSQPDKKVKYREKNLAYTSNKSLSSSSIDSLRINALPFRITDITKTSRRRFTAINYFYKGGGGDTIYRLPPTDPQYPLIHNETGFTDYSRLVTIAYRKRQFSWSTVWTFPKEYTGYNWEGIAATRNGYFLLNDKFTKTRPYSSVLLFLEFK